MNAITPAFILFPYSSDSGRRQIDFFCETEENKTELQEQYCEDFQVQQDFNAIASIILVGLLILFIVYVCRN